MYIFSLASNHQHHNTSRFPSALQQNRAQSRSFYSFYIREFVKFHSLYSKQIIIFEAKKSVVRMFCTLIKHAKISQSKSLSKGIHSMQITAATSRGNPPQFKTKPSVLGKFARAKCKCFFKRKETAQGVCEWTTAEFRGKWRLFGMKEPQNSAAVTDAAFHSTHRKGYQSKLLVICSNGGRRNFWGLLPCVEQRSRRWASRDGPHSRLPSLWHRHDLYEF